MQSGMIPKGIALMQKTTGGAMKGVPGRHTETNAIASLLSIQKVILSMNGWITAVMDLK